MKVAYDDKTIELVQEAQALVRKKYAKDFAQRNKLMKLSPWGVMEHGSATLQRRLRDATFYLGEVNLALNLKTARARHNRLEKLIATVKKGRAVRFGD